eukprot:10856143-Ditylum_brightwellii.AAC.1
MLQEKLKKIIPDIVHMILSQTKESKNNIIRGIQDIKTKSTSGNTENTVSVVTTAALEVESHSFTDGEITILTPENDKDLLTQEQTHESAVQTEEADNESSSESSSNDNASNNSSDKDDNSFRKASKYSQTSTIQKKVMSSAMVTSKLNLLQQRKNGCSPQDINLRENEKQQE